MGGWHWKLKMGRTKSDLLEVKTKRTPYYLWLSSHTKKTGSKDLHPFAKLSCRIQIKLSQ